MYINFRISDPQEVAMAETLFAAFAGNRSEALRAVIAHYVQDKLTPAALTLGYVAIDRRGDLDANAPCPQCGEPLAKPYLWFAANGTFGIVCSNCATSK